MRSLIFGLCAMVLDAYPSKARLMDKRRTS